MHISWSPQAGATFQYLKDSFTTAPVLTLLDPSLQLVVRLKTLDIGIGAILAQRLVNDNKLQKMLSPAEWNYDVGDQQQAHWALFSTHFNLYCHTNLAPRLLNLTFCPDCFLPPERASFQCVFKSTSSVPYLGMRDECSFSFCHGSEV